MVWDGLVKNNLTIGCLRTIIPIHITDIWKPMGNPVLRCLIMAFFRFLKSALCKWSISNFFTPINRLNKADKNWESIVAQSTENIGNHIVKNSRTRTHKNHKHVAVGIFWYIMGDSHKCYKAMRKQSAYQCKYNCKKYTQNNWNKFPRITGTANFNKEVNGFPVVKSFLPISETIYQISLTI